MIKTRNPQNTVLFDECIVVNTSGRVTIHSTQIRDRSVLRLQSGCSATNPAFPSVLAPITIVTWANTRRFTTLSLPFHLMTQSILLTGSDAFRGSRYISLRLFYAPLCEIWAFTSIPLTLYDYFLVIPHTGLMVTYSRCCFNTFAYFSWRVILRT